MRPRPTYDSLPEPNAPHSLHNCISHAVNTFDTATKDQSGCIKSRSGNVCLTEQWGDHVRNRPTILPFLRFAAT